MRTKQIKRTVEIKNRLFCLFKIEKPKKTKISEEDLTKSFRDR